MEKYENAKKNGMFKIRKEANVRQEYDRQVQQPQLY